MTRFARRREVDDVFDRRWLDRRLVGEVGHPAAVAPDVDNVAA